MTAAEDVALAQVVRREAGLIVASLHRRTGDFDVAEEAVQEAVVAALRTWRTGGVPPNPGGWLATTARRRAIDLLRQRSRQIRLLTDLGRDPTETRPAADPPPGPGFPGAGDDDRLPMLFGCCHPSLAVEAQVALTLRAVVGVTTDQIARAFLVPVPTMAQRLVRAKHKIAAAGVPFTVPDDAELPGRLDQVLTVVCLAYNAGYLEADGGQLVDDAVWLAELIARALPGEPEAWGLLSLLTNLSARAGARFDAAGHLVLLGDQDRSRWDAVAMARAEGYLTRAAALGRPGRFQLQAAIAACHAAAPIWAATDWLQVVTLYDLLLRYDRSPVVRLNQAIALRHLDGPRTALAQVDRLAAELADYHLLHATRASLLSELGDLDGARAANRRALELAANPVEQDLLRSRLASSEG